MKIVAQVKLQPGSVYVADSLAATLRACNRAANWISEVAHERDLKRRNELHHAVYYDMKATYDLAAQASVRTIKKVVDAYATLAGNIKNGNLSEKAEGKATSKPIRFRENAAQPFDDHCLTWNVDEQTVSIWTVAGRIKGIPFVCSSEALKLLASRKGESDLVFRDGSFYLTATIDLPEPDAYEPEGWLGVDLGIVNIATTNDGAKLSGRRVNRYRRRINRLRTKLQKKGTKSAKRRLKSIRHREARFATDTNHVVSKTIVITAERTSRGVALEDLKGIRKRVTARKEQRYRLHSWAFAQLGAFVEYKAKRAGVPVVHVDPRNTSRQCSECWHTHRTNRVSQAWFACRSCGNVMNADRNGSRNIAHRADAVWQRGEVKRPRTVKQHA
ncbi:RNA-guided endonuclease TnpB family protein [Streptomyces sp. NBC_01808]|uniref:RNA-guided endonuclease InsQ/TnpB family protein n=1 Tax=Streptomyces sp. NBC_01808 TaxID=2975947 RepID=UPI002DDC7839|nr:transposase [Streptomyces sp. NBC_01808]WSA37968.1 RNA-guided endonuclease TnpB family protein [Streptomyces sp. NBC_01808]